MSGFSTEETDAILQHRSDDKNRIEQKHEIVARKQHPRRYNTNCIVCNSPMRSLSATTDDFPICEACL